MSPSHRILVADADADTREIYATVLRHRGAEVVLAENAGTALRLALETPFTALVSEFLWLPDGDALYLRLCGGARESTLCIYIVTADMTKARHAAALAAGCDAVILKPLPPRTLADLVLGEHTHDADPGAGSPPRLRSSGDSDHGPAGLT